MRAAVPQIPNVQLLGEIGRGAQSVVFKGRRGSAYVAVKVPVETGEGAHRYRQQYFYREAVALARVQHRSLPEVLELGEAEGVPYLILQLVSGEPLADRLRRGPIPEKEVLGIAQQLVGALSAIHSAGLVHRDVKPANIVSRDDGVVWLLDFGLAVPTSVVSQRLTGTLPLPEVLTGANTADPSVDVYALACVIVECLSGRRLRENRPDPIAALRLTSASLKLRSILEKMLAPRRVDRPNARAVERALLFLADGGIEGPQPVLEEGYGQAGQAGRRLVGRKRELQAARAAWAAAQHQTNAFFIFGDAGAGKTALVDAVVEEARQNGASVLRATGNHWQSTPYSVIRQLFDSYLQDPRRDPHRIDLLRRTAGDLGALAKLLSPLMAHVFQDAPSLPTAERADHVFVEGIAELLRKLLAEIGSSLVAIDDIQWMDSNSRRVLIRAFSRGGLECLITLSSRSIDGGDGDLSRFVRALAGVRQTQIALASLAEDELLDIAREFLGARELEQELIQLLLAFSDGTPLNTLELVRTLLEAGVVRPHWGRWLIDRAALTQLNLPKGAVQMLLRRVSGLEARERDVLEAAAVLGSVFEDALIGAMLGVEELSVEAELASARLSQLVERSSAMEHRFVHECVREALLSGLNDRHRRDLNAAAGRAILRRVEDFDELVRVAKDFAASNGVAQLSRKEKDVTRIYAAAAHFAEAGSVKDSRQVLELGLVAGYFAFAGFDNQRALGFFDAAAAAAEHLGSGLPVETKFIIGEAHLRIGAIEKSLTFFRECLQGAEDPMLVALVRSRVAWVYEQQLDSARSWAELGLAFEALGEVMPTESGSAVADSLLSWTRRAIGGRSSIAQPSERRRVELLCSMYLQVGRLAFQGDQPQRFILSTLGALGRAERLGVSQSLAKAYLMYSFILGVVGLKGRAAEYMARAEKMAQALADPVTYSYALQVHGVVAAWSGDVERSIKVTGQALQDYGHWRELSEFCLACVSQASLESIRGRLLSAWRWLELAIQRVSQSEGAFGIPELLELVARATLIGLGREGEVASVLSALGGATVRVPSNSGFYSWTFAPRLRVYTERMDLGDGFRHLVTEFESAGYSPRRVHLSVVEAYVQVAHARVHQCVRALPMERSEHMVGLEHALQLLKCAARIPLMDAHRLVIQGYREWLNGSQRSAEKYFDRAERAAAAQTAPWVAYAVHRGRAHMLREQGLEDAAHDQAVLAEAVAMEHGAVYRARWVREEFGLVARRAGDSSSYSSISDISAYAAGLGGSRARRQLRALTRISQAKAQELDPDHQTRAVIDEVIQALHASRGALFLEPDLAGQGEEQGISGDLRLVAVRDVSGRDLADLDDHDRNVVREAFVHGASGDGDAQELSTRSSLGTTSRLATMAAPLVVADRTAGVVYLDRPLADGIFTDADAEVFAVLATQVSVALELARSLNDRERAEESRRNAEKMEAVGRLAGGLAHDLNNMLAAIRYSTGAMLSDPALKDLVANDVGTIQGAAQRAEELTRQLSAFSRGEMTKRVVVNLNDRLERLAPVLRGLLGEDVELELRLEHDLGIIVADPDQIDQVVTNLAINARDAMAQHGGTLALETRNAVLSEEFARNRTGLSAGHYVELCVSDTGQGMDSQTLDRIFEPFFTTKGERGTGLGLASVYGIVQNSGGYIHVESEVGKGSTFHVYLPRGPETLQEQTEPAFRGRGTVLLVVDDPLLAGHLERSLVELGYAVITSHSSREALRVTARRSNEIRLVIADVALPGMNGLELAREIEKLESSPKVLHFSRSATVLAERGISGEPIDVMKAPVPLEVLASRVREALGGP